MKKALKTILVVILCLAAAAGTGYLFFANLTKSVSAFESVNTFYNSVEQYELRLKINKVLSIDSTRFNQLSGVYTDLKETMFYTNAHLVTLDNTSIGNNVNTKLNALESEGKQLADMLDEYEIKCGVEGFNKITGADDIYVKFSHYLVDFASFVEYLNFEATKYSSTASVDMRYSLIDAYMNIVKTSLTGITAKQTDLPSLNYISTKFSMQKGYLKTNNANGDFALETNKFVEYYNKSDKQSFAKNLMSNLEVATASSTTNELLATYYMGLILGR